jgi:hypothetical protein
MPDYQNITRASSWAPGRDEALHVADDTNCVRWIGVPDEPRQEPFVWPCYHHRDEDHLWRTAWVIA